MKAIINGKRYDTETAEEIASYDNGVGYSDFTHVSMTLYKTKKGAWFVAGDGGPMSRFAKSTGNSTSGGEGIQIVSEDEAREMLESWGETEALEQYMKIVDA
jgi:hypothetical protein